MAEYRIIPLHQLNDTQILQLARLHRNVMHSLLTDLGFPFLERYYQIARNDPTVIGFCIVSSKDELLGWVNGSPDPGKINHKLNEPLNWFASQMFRLLFAHPLVLLQLISSVFSSNDQHDMDSATMELTYIGVASGHTGMGFGAQLVDRFVGAVQEAGYHSIVLSVEVDNQAAIALYKRSGFEIIRTFKEGRYQRHRMQLGI